MTSMISGMGSSAMMNAMNTKRLTGLASGLDTDALVEGMTAGTRGKIAKARQDKQKLLWKMDAYRSISSKLIAFQKKFTDYASSTNLRGAALFGKSVISAHGANSKYVSVSGNGDRASNLEVLGVTQLASQASTTTGTVSSGSLTSGTVQTGDVTVSNMAGEFISLKYNNQNFTIALEQGKNFESIDDVVKEINKQFAETDYGKDGKHLSDQLEAVYDSTSKKMQLKVKDNAGNSVEITGVGDNIMVATGLETGAKGDADKPLTGSKEITDEDIKKASVTKSASQTLAGQKFTFEYNGKQISVTLPKDAKDISNPDGTLNIESLAKAIQSEMNKEVGPGRIQVSGANGKLEFKTISPNGAEDKSSSLRLASGDPMALKALNMKNGDSNRLNMSSTIEDFMKSKGQTTVQDTYKINIRDEVAGKDNIIEFKKGDTLEDVIRKINEDPGANVKVEYSSTTDRFTIISKQEGASGKFSIKDVDGGNLKNTLFGTGEIKAAGTDAEVWVSINGQTEKIVRGTNNITLDKMTISVSGTFGVERDASGNVVMDKDVPKFIAGDKVTFDAKVDSEKLTTTVKEMVEAFNEIIELSNKMVGEKPNRKYAPLTNEQRKEMSEEEIKNWEEKAKEGMLFNDPDLRAFTSEIRHLFSADSETMRAFEKIGITVSSSQGDHGKLKFDEEKFKAAAEGDIESIKNLFTAIEEKGADGAITQKAGVMTKINDIFDKYAATDKAIKGVFVQKAGAVESPLSMLKNDMQKRIDGVDDIIETLNRKLKGESERYYQRFSRLEVYISNMNSQSAWLSQQFGGMQ